MKTFNEKLASWIHATPATEAGINNIQVQVNLNCWFGKHVIKNRLSTNKTL